MNKKSLAIASLVLAIVSLIPLILSPDTLSAASTFALIGVFIAIAAIVLGFIGKSASKGFGIAGIVIGVIAAGLLGLAVLGFGAMKNATNCVDLGNGMSKCEYAGQELEMPTPYVTEEQKKK